MTRTKSVGSPALRWLLTLVGAGLLAPSAPAAEVRVQVVDAVGRAPLADAAVCLGTPADATQFGAVRTGAGGEVRFSDVPDTPLLLTVSRDQYRGYQRRHPAKRFDVVLEVALHTGGLGPACNAPVRAGQAQQERLAINGFTLNAGRAVTRQRRVLLSAQVLGNPTHFRVSERADFSDADWQPFSLPSSFHLSQARGDKVVYFQVRRFRDAGSASMQTLSSVAQAQIRLQ